MSSSSKGLNHGLDQPPAVQPDIVADHKGPATCRRHHPAGNPRRNARIELVRDNTAHVVRLEDTEVQSCYLASA